MPNWKKLIVSGSDAYLSNLNVDNAVTASYFKGDGSALTNVQTEIAETATVVDSFTNQTVVQSTHNFDTKNVIISVYNDQDEQIIPASVSTPDTNNVSVTFDVSTSGRVVIAKGGHLISGTSANSNTLNGQSGSYYLDYTNFTNTPSESFADRILSNSVSIQEVVDTTGSFATTGSNTFFGTEIVSGALYTNGQVLFENIPWPATGSETHILKTAPYTLNLDSGDRNYSYLGLALEHFEEQSIFHNSLLFYTYDNHVTPSYGSEMNVGPVRTHMRVFASGSNSFGNISVRDLEQGETNALVYADYVEIGGYRGKDIRLGNTGSIIHMSGSRLTVGSDITASGHIVPSTTDTYDLGTPTQQWRDLYLSSGSLYIDGTKIISSDANVLTFTTDVGQSIKILETGADDITLQTDTGNIELKGTVEVLSGKKIIDSAGTIIQFGDSLGVTGSIEVSGTVDGIDLQLFSSSLETRVSQASTDLTGINSYTASLKDAISVSGANLTVLGDLTVAGTTTTVNSTTVDIGDNIISLNGTGSVLGGIHVNDGPSSGSLLWDGTANHWIAGPSGSEEQIAYASQITGSFTSLSASIATDIAAATASIYSSSVDILNLQSDSGSFSIRISTNESDIADLQSDSGSFSTRISTNESNISGLQSDSGSFSTRVGVLELLSSSLNTLFVDEQQLTTISGSFSNRIHNVEVVTAKTLISSSAQIASDISGSFLEISSSLEQRVAAQEIFSSSLDTTALTLSGSFSGSFVGDGSQLSGVTSYTDADTLSFIQGYSGSYSGSFIGDGSQLSGVTSYTDQDTLTYINSLGVISGSAQISTGSFTGSFDGVFTGDGSGLTNLPALNTLSSSFESTSSLVVEHNLETKNITVAVYNTSDTLIIPDEVTLLDNQRVKLEFAGDTAGYVVINKGGHTVLASGSIPFVNIIDKPTLISSSAQLASDISGSFTSVAATKLDISETASFARFNENNTFTGTQTFNNIDVSGTASFGYIQSVTGSATYIGEQYIVVNASIDGARFAGIQVYDSESTMQHTASLSWDSLKNKWVYSNPSGSYHGGGLISGPRNTGSLGDETYPTLNTLTRGQGGDHIYDSNITDDDTTVSIGIDTSIIGDLSVSSDITGSGILATSVDATTVTTTTVLTTGFSATSITGSSSTLFGTSYDDTHIFTGSLSIHHSLDTTSGSLGYVGGQLTVQGDDADINLDITTGSAIANLTELRYRVDGGTMGRLYMHKYSKHMYLGPENFATASLYLRDGAGTSMTLTGSKVGIGTTTPTQALEVVGSVLVDGGAGDPKIYFDNTNNYLAYNSDDSYWKADGVHYFEGASAFKGAWLADGKLGVGTSSPKAQLHLNDGGSYNNTDENNRLFIEHATRSPYILFSSADDKDNGIHFHNTTDDGFVGRIAYQHRSTGDFMHFRVGTTSGDGQLSIDSSGSIGINNTAPSYSLDVNGTAYFQDAGVKFIGGVSYNENIRMYPGSNDYSSLVIGAVSGDSGAGVGQWTLVRYPTATTSNKFSIRHNTTDAITILTDGKVGIGEGTPTTPLHVSGKIYSTTEVQGGVATMRTYAGYSFFGSNASSTPIAIGRDGTNYDIVIDADGDVGIGTNSPETKLHVSSGAHTKLRVSTTGTADASVEILGYDAGVHIGDPTNGNRWAIWNDGVSTSSSLKIGSYALGTWYSDSSQVATITSDGKVGIGTTSLTSKLTVAGNLGAVVGGGNSSIRMVNTDTGNYASISAGVVGAYNDGMDFSVDGTRMMVLRQNNLGIGTPTPSEKLDVNGNLKGGRFISNDIVLINKGASDSVQQGSSVYLDGGSGSSYTQLQQGVGRFTVWGYNGSWAEKMTIRHSDGNVGIGTTSPDNKLTVRGSNALVDVQSSADGQTIGLLARYQNNATLGGRFIYTTGDAQLYIDNLYGGNNGVYSDITFRNCTTGGTLTNRMRIKGSTGNVGIATDTPGYKLEVNGSFGATSITETSALRFKENINPLESQLENIKKLNPVTFDWKKDKKHDIGFIAEEVEEVLPDLVSYVDEEVQGLHYTKFTAVLVKAIQEQQAQIEKLRKEIDKLKNS